MPKPKIDPIIENCIVSDDEFSLLVQGCTTEEKVFIDALIEVAPVAINRKNIPESMFDGGKTTLLRKASLQQGYSLYKADQTGKIARNIIHFRKVDKIIEDKG